MPGKVDSWYTFYLDLMEIVRLYAKCSASDCARWKLEASQNRCFTAIYQKGVPVVLSFEGNECHCQQDRIIIYLE